MSDGITASCLCGEIRLTLKDREFPAQICHCRECRQAQGGLAAVNAPVADEEILAFEGIDHLCEFESSPGKFRAFCMRCGSPVYSRRADKPGIFRLRTGLFEDRARVVLSEHIFYEDRAHWDTCMDDLPRHDAFPPA